MKASGGVGGNESRLKLLITRTLHVTNLDRTNVYCKIHVDMVRDCDTKEQADGSVVAQTMCCDERIINTRRKLGVALSMIEDTMSRGNKGQARIKNRNEEKMESEVNTYTDTADRVNRELPGSDTHATMTIRMDDDSFRDTPSVYIKFTFGPMINAGTSRFSFRVVEAAVFQSAFYAKVDSFHW
eukprot:gene864-1846_t